MAKAVPSHEARDPPVLQVFGVESRASGLQVGGRDERVIDAAWGRGLVSGHGFGRAEEIPFCTVIPSEVEPSAKRLGMTELGVWHG